MTISYASTQRQGGLYPPSPETWTRDGGIAKYGQINEMAGILSRLGQTGGAVWLAERPKDVL